MRQRAILAAIATFGLGAPVALGAPVSYTDTQGDSLGSVNGGRDLVGATVTNDANNLIFTLTFNPATTTNASGTETPANITTASYNYVIGITTGPGAGGDTQAATDHGNPYSRAISIDSSLGGMTDFIGIFGAGGSGTTASPFTSYGFNDYVYGTPNNTTTTPSAWTKIDTVASGQPVSATAGDATPNTVTVTVPLADFAANLQFAAGTPFQFDVFTTGTSAGQTAYDSLANPSPTQSPTYVATAQYNALVLNSYTVQAPVPEPASLAVVGVGALGLLQQRRRRSVAR